MAEGERESQVKRGSKAVRDLSMGRWMCGSWRHWVQAIPVDGAVDVRVVEALGTGHRSKVPDTQVLVGRNGDEQISRVQHAEAHHLAVKSGGQTRVEYRSTAVKGGRGG